MDAGLGFGPALHADALARALAGAGVRRGPLTTHGQAAQVANATIALDPLQALEVHAHLAAEVAFDHVAAVLDGMDDLRNLLLRKVLGADVPLDLRALQDVE